MKDTVSLKFNHEFRRLYAKGKSAVSPCVAVYCRKNRLDHNRLGLTVGTKVGKAVLRNRTRRRLREAYRLHEDQLVRGYDIVVVGRVRADFAHSPEMERHPLKTMNKLGLVKRDS